MQSYCCIPIQNQVYLNSDRTMCIKLKIDLQTGSDKCVTGNVTFYWAHFPSS